MAFNYSRSRIRSKYLKIESDITDLHTLFSLADSWKPRMVEYNRILQTNASLWVENVFEEFINKLDISTTPGTDVVSDGDYSKLEWHLREVTETQGQNKLPYIKPYIRSNLVEDAAAYCLSRHRCDAGGKPIGQLQLPFLFKIMMNCNLFDRWHDTITRITCAYLEISFEDSMADKLNKLPDIFQVKNQLECVDKKRINDDSVTDQIGSTSHDTMADIQADLEKPDYVNWLMGSLVLKYLCEPTRKYELCVFEKFQSGLYNSGEHFNDGENVRRMSNSVYIKCNKWVFPTYLSHCNECETLFNEIIAHHQKKDHSIGFRNCKTNAVAGAWGIAKLFMPKQHWAVKGPEDSDTLALLHIILNCDLFNSCDYEVVDTILCLRNKLMHSPNLTMTGDNLTLLYDSALDFLKNVQEHEKQVDVSLAKDKIEQLKHREKIKFSIEQAEEAITFQFEDGTKSTSEDTDQVTMRLIEKKSQKLKTYSDRCQNEENIKEILAMNGALAARKKVNDQVRELQEQKSNLEAELIMLELKRVQLREL